MLYDGQLLRNSYDIKGVRILNKTDGAISIFDGGETELLSPETTPLVFNYAILL